MNRTAALCKMRFDEAYKGCTEKRLSQSEAAEILGVCGRTFRQYVQRFTQTRKEAVSAAETGNAFVPVVGVNLDTLLCEQFERTVGKDNCVRFDTQCLQIPPDRHCMLYVKATVQVQRYTGGHQGLFHGPRCSARPFAS